VATAEENQAPSLTFQLSYPTILKHDQRGPGRQVANFNEVRWVA
jgi:hypothetical protein